jgi:NDP-sugar pyrophosphorylase family protein
MQEGQMTIINRLSWFLERFIWRPLIKRTYNYDCVNGWYFVKHHLIWQKIFRINGEVPWPVHPSLRITNWERISRQDTITIPGASLGSYIQAGNGIEFGSNVMMGPNVGIISANHEMGKIYAWKKSPPIRIGSNVWIGMNAVVLPGVIIGDNVVIGAGSIVTKSIPANSMAAGNPCRVIRNI